MAALAEEMTADYRRNLEAMGIDTIDHFPKATENMGQIIQFIEQLIDKGFAYASEGDVYFDVAKDREYGKLSNRDVASMQGEGGDMAERKHSPIDFALWKSAKPGEPSWDSPWGKGRPGWHIECSAMSHAILGETFDIHGGGLDLVFPHHENEIAQSECCHGKPQAKYWMHNGLMQASSEVGKIGGRATREADTGDQQAQEAGKMGKSKGASAFSELLERHAPETIRFFLLSTHYRRPIDYSEARIEEVNIGLEQFYRFFKRYERITGESFYDVDYAHQRPDGEFDAGKNPTLVAVSEARQRFLDGDGRRLQHRRRGGRFVRAGADPQQVHRREQARRKQALGRTIGDAAAGRGHIPRVGGHPGIVPSGGRQAGCLGRQRAGRQADEPDHRAAGLGPGEEGFCHGRSHSRGADRAGHHAGRSPRRHRMDRQMSMPGVRILGVDPGLNITGYGVLEVSRTSVVVCEAGVVRGRTKTSLAARLAEIRSGMADVIATLKPHSMALEQLYSHYKHPRTAILMGHARGVICLSAAEADVPVIHYSATQIKKVLTGNGRAPKHQMQLAIRRELGLAEVPEPPDVADALAIALCHYYLKIRRSLIEPKPA